MLFLRSTKQPEKSIMKYSVNIIGAGKLGKAIGKLISIFNVGNINSICNSAFDSSTNATLYIGSGNPVNSIHDLPPADITLITTPDDIIEEAAKALASSPNLKIGSTIIHCSGSKSSDALISLEEAYCFTASVHPMRSFSNPDLSIADFKNTYCAVEGCNQGAEIARHIFNAIGGITYHIESTKKPLYHAAGVFASNYLITIANQSLTCLQESGVEHDTAIKVIVSLMHSTIMNIENNLSLPQSLTGPIARGDIGTIKNHLQNMPFKKMEDLYSLLGKSTLELTTHDKKTQEEVNQALTITPLEHTTNDCLFFSNPSV